MATDALIEILDSVPADVANRLEKYGKAIDKAKASGIRSMFEIAKNLRMANDELANNKNGSFCAWVQQRCGFTIRTADRYLRVLARFGDEYVDSLSKYFTAEALYYLAQEATPAGAVTSAIEAAESGERINLEAARELVAEYTVDEPEPDWELFPALQTVTDYVEKRVSVWPTDCRSALVARLRSLADDIDSGVYDEEA